MINDLINSIVPASTVRTGNQDSEVLKNLILIATINNDVFLASKNGGTSILVLCPIEDVVLIALRAQGYGVSWEMVSGKGQYVISWKESDSMESDKCIFEHITKKPNHKKFDGFVCVGGKA